MAGSEATRCGKEPEGGSRGNSSFEKSVSDGPRGEIVPRDSILEKRRHPLPCLMLVGSSLQRRKEAGIVGGIRY